MKTDFSTTIFSDDSRTTWDGTDLKTELEVGSFMEKVNQHDLEDSWGKSKVSGSKVICPFRVNDGINLKRLVQVFKLKSIFVRDKCSFTFCKRN